MVGVIRSRAGARHLMANPVVVAPRNTDLLIRLASKRLKGMAIPFRATLFEKSRTTNWRVPWHQDKAFPSSADSSLRTGERGRRHHIRSRSGLGPFASCGLEGGS